MFGLRRKAKSSSSKQRVEGGRKYRQIAVTPAAHAKISKMAKKQNTTMIDLIDELVGA